MKGIVFGASGFIGSHVAEQLKKDGYEVHAIVRDNSDTTFLDSLDIKIIKVDFQKSVIFGKKESRMLSDAIIYNCIAYKSDQATLEGYREIEIDLTKKIINESWAANAKKYVQLSSIVAYGIRIPEYPIDETYQPRPQELIEISALEREQCVERECNRLGFDFVILEPVTAIGIRDNGSFFTKMLDAYHRNQFPLIGGGKAKFSALDVRDIGKAMAWIGKSDSAINNRKYLLKGYDISWFDLKSEFDNVFNRSAKAKYLPIWLAKSLAFLLEKTTKKPKFNRLSAYALSSDRIYDDSRIKKAGFQALYNFNDSIRAIAKS